MPGILYPTQIKYLKQFKKDEDPLITEMEQYAKEHNVPILSWHSAAFLEQVISMINPKRVLEIGTAIAYSTIRIAKVLKKKSVIHTIEMSEDNAIIAKENIEKSGLVDKIDLKIGNALSIMPQLQKKYDLIFLDADKEDYKRLFDYSMILLKRGGVIFVDNLLWHGLAATKKVPKEYKISTKFIREFNKVFMNQPNLTSTILPIGDGIGLGIKK
ncbi:MAG: methyltransferase [Ignavibacteria bacterium RBG_16_34_14]|nr:MAG: methyltransferase [Ignavibacteria bacterium RBG_16_34_14]